MKSVFSTLALVSSIALASESHGELPHKGALVLMKKPANTCAYEGPRTLCRSSALVGAKVYVRQLYSPTVRLANTNQQGVLSIRLMPGRYEIGLSGRYAYRTMNRAFGMRPCDRNISTNGGFSCPEQSGCFPMTRYPLSYPPHYRESEDPQLTSYADAEASVFVHVTNATRRLSLEYYMRCI